MPNQSDIRLVAHFDILGMSALVDRDFSEAWGMLGDLVDVQRNARMHEYEFVETNERVDVFRQIQSVTFSDTLLLFTQGATPAELKALIILSTEIFHKALFNCVPIRAAVAIGEFRFDTQRSMYAGPALIEAYRVGEAAQWLGICIAPSLRDLALAQRMKSRQSDVIVDWEVPLKHGNDVRAVVNWPAVFAHDFRVAPPISVPQFYVAFRKSFGEFDHLPREVQAKYIHTVEFINRQLPVAVQA